MADRDRDAHAEILRLRDRMHKAENLLTSHQMMADLVPDLVKYKDRATGGLIVLSAAVSAVTAVAVKLIG